MSEQLKDQFAEVQTAVNAGDEEGIREGLKRLTDNPELIRMFLRERNSEITRLRAEVERRDQNIVQLNTEADALGERLEATYQETLQLRQRAEQAERERATAFEANKKLDEYLTKAYAERDAALAKVGVIRQALSWQRYEMNKVPFHIYGTRPRGTKLEADDDLKRLFATDDAGAMGGGSA